MNLVSSGSLLNLVSFLESYYPPSFPQKGRFQLGENTYAVSPHSIINNIALCFPDNAPFLIASITGDGKVSPFCRDVLIVILMPRSVPLNSSGKCLYLSVDIKFALPVTVI